MSNNKLKLILEPVVTRSRRSSSTISVDVNAVEQGTRSKKKNSTDKIKSVKSSRSRSKDTCLESITVDELVNILNKEEGDRNMEENKILEEWSALLPEAENRREKIKSKLAKTAWLKQRAVEHEESLESIEEKATILANLIRESRHTVIYTGAGISTSASIPDYRGPNGLWTQIKKTGTFSITQIHDLSAAVPTLTHMAIRELGRRRIVKHVVSQNCDGLHLRSGIPKSNLSEIHGNMYIEVCPTCEKQYYRQADVTERTSRFRHKTGRKCHSCAEPNNNLIDTIVLFGERSRTQWPMNWESASKAAKRADLIICIGSSLKTLRRYECLWPKKICASGGKKPDTKLVIINLQYTSKDKNAVLKINGKCDVVMQIVMQKLKIDVPDYDWTEDPLNKIAIPFTSEERSVLKRNLIFETKIRQTSRSPSPGSNKRGRELSESPGLFVSEYIDDPARKKLRMRIRAVGTESPSELAIDQDLTNVEDITVKQEEDEKPVAKAKIGFALPGWLGKSLGASRSSSYRRKRHGNKGRKHPNLLKSQRVNDSKGPADETSTEDAVLDNEESSNLTEPESGLKTPISTGSGDIDDETNLPLSKLNCVMHLPIVSLNESLAIKQET